MQASSQIQRVKPELYPAIDFAINTMEGLKPYVGKVVKYTQDNGKNYEYVLLNQPLFSAEPDNIKLAGFAASHTVSFWGKRSVCQQTIINSRFFDPRANGNQKITFSTATFDEIKDLKFPCTGRMRQQHASQEHICPHVNPSNVLCEAPLTVVRAEQPGTALKISLLMGDHFSLIEPTVPKPTSESINSHSWNVITHGDHSIGIERKFANQDMGIEYWERASLIWWEASRKNVNLSKETFKFEDSLCVDKNDLSYFLHAVLTKMGVSENEMLAFTHYWHSRFDFDDSVKYVQVRIPSAQELKELLPEMTVSSSDAKFELIRPYFQFQVVDHTGKGLSSDEFFKNIPERKLGKNAVIDMGGEVLGKAVARDPDFQEEFIKGFIKG